MRKHALAGACVALVLYGINSAECAPNKLRRVGAQRRSVEHVKNERAAARHQGAEGLETLSYPAEPADDLMADFREGDGRQEEVDAGTEQPDEDDEDATYVSSSEEVEASEAEGDLVKWLKSDLDARAEKIKYVKPRLLLAWIYVTVTYTLLFIIWRLTLGHADADYYRLGRSENFEEFMEALGHFRDTHLIGNPIYIPLLVLCAFSVHAKITFLVRLFQFFRLYLPLFGWRTFEKFYQQAEHSKTRASRATK